MPLNNNPQFGTLREISLREAWPHEAHQFTPWLAENLDRLSEALGIELELAGREVAVDDFSADILARNPQDGSLVLIENQLEGSNHTHLGQILTYLAGVKAETVVWVARRFHEAHLAALHWLNENTIEPFSFFAVRVKVVRIGDSAMAPVFEVLARPNNWQREVTSAARDAAPESALGTYRLGFWTDYVTRHPREAARGAATRASTRVRSLPDQGLVVVQYVAKESVGVFIRARNGVPTASVYTQLLPYREPLRSALGVDVGAEDAKYLFVQSLRGDASDLSARPRLLDWLHATANHYEQVLTGVLGSAPPQA